MSTTAITLRAPQPADRARWEELWHGYLRFYRAQLDAEVTEATWRRLLDAREQPHGLLAVSDGRIVGFAHYLFHRASWAIGDYCYLEDLFVAEDARGLGCGRALIEAVYKAADTAGASSVYWLTQEYNVEARALYDTLAKRTSFIKYVRE